MHRISLIIFVATLASCGGDASKVKSNNSSPNNVASNNDDNECGDGWCQFAAPVPYLLGAWGTSREDWWAVGAEGSVVHGSGSSFTVLDSPTTARLEAVWGTGPDDVWIVGEQGTVLHADASGVQDVSPSLPEITYDAIGYYDGRVYVLADGRIDRQAANGSGWETALEVPGLNAASLVECGGRAWVTGGGRVLWSEDAEVWHELGLRQATENVQDVLVLGPDDAYIAAGVLMHWDGTVWTHTLDPVSTGIIELEPDFVGGFWALRADGILVHFDGTSWTEVDDFNFEWDFAPFPDATFRWMWTDRPNELWLARTSIASGVEHWTVGGDLRIQGTGSVWAPSDVHWVSPTQAWAVGINSTLEHFENDRWNEVVELPVIGSAVWASGPDDVWIGGREGWVGHWDGTSLTEHSPPLADTSDERWRDIFEAGGELWFAARSDVLRYRAGQWETFPDTEFGGGSRASFGGTADDLWFVTGRSSAMRWNGVEWTRFDVDHGIHESFCVNDELWGVQAEGGGIYRFTSGAWTEVAASRQSVNSARAWIGSPTFGYAIQQLEAYRIAHFDGTAWNSHVDDVGTLTDVWGWNETPGGIAVGTTGTVYLLGN